MPVNDYGIQVLGTEQATKLVGQLPESPDQILARLMGNSVASSHTQPAMLDSSLLPDVSGFNNILEAADSWALDFLVDRNLDKAIDQLLSAELPENTTELCNTLAHYAMPGCWTRVNFSGKLSYCDTIPNDELGVVFDTETFVKYAKNKLGSSMPIIGTAVTHKAFYIWLHRSWDEETPYKPTTVSLGDNKLIVAHNISFDMPRATEKYSFYQKLYGLCTMALNNIINGLDASVRYSKNPKIKEWGCGGSLKEAFEYNLGKPFEGDKATRNIFVEAESFQEFIDNREELLQYAVYDVVAALELFQYLYPKVLEWSNGSYVPIVGMITVADSLLPVLPGRSEWIAKCDQAAEDVLNKVVDLIMPAATDLHEDWLSGNFDPDSAPATLGKLDWRLHKPKNYRKKVLPEGWPIKARWYEKLERKDLKLKGNDLPNILQLQYLEHDLFQVYKEGWQYIDQYDDVCKVPHESGVEGQNVGGILSSPSIRFVVDDDDVPLKEPFLTSKVLNQNKLIELLFLLDSNTTWSGFGNRVKEAIVVCADGKVVE